MSSNQLSGGVAAGPSNLVQFFVMFVKSLFKNIIVKLIIFAAVFLAIMILYTYILVVKNEGFAYGSNETLNAVLGLKKSGISAFRQRVTTLNGSLFWMLTAGMFFATIARIFKFGLFTFIKDVIMELKDILSTVFSGFGAKKLTLFLLGAVVSLVAGLVLANYTIMLLLGIFFFLSASLGSRSVFLMLIRLFNSDFTSIFKIKARKYDDANTKAFFGGCVAGCVFSFIVINLIKAMPFKIIIICLLFAIMIANALNKKNAAAALFILFAQFSVMMLLGRQVLADDGGWQEAGGTFDGWWNSPGRDQAVGMGVPPSLWSSVASAVGASIPGFASSAFGGVPSPLGSSMVRPQPAFVQMPQPTLMYGIPQAPTPVVPGTGLPSEPVPALMYGIPQAPVPPLSSMPPGLRPMYGIGPFNSHGVPGTPTPPPIQPMYGIKITPDASWGPSVSTPPLRPPEVVLMYGIKPTGIPDLHSVNTNIPEIRLMYGIRPAPSPSVGMPGPSSIGSPSLPAPDIKPMYGISVKPSGTPVSGQRPAYIPGTPAFKPPEMVLMYGIRPQGNLNIQAVNTPVPELRLMYGVMPSGGR